MLSDGETETLVLLERLGRSPAALHEQQELVIEITAAISKLEDAAEAAAIEGYDSSERIVFIELARKRLVEAQRRAVESNLRLREQRTAKKEAHTRDTASEGGLAASDERRALFGEEDNDEGLMKSLQETKSESITRVLQRMHDLAQAEVLKGELNINELDMSSRTLRELQEKYSGVDMLLNGSKRLVQLLDQADKWDRWCMLASLGFLATVMLYIIYRRILSGPVKILLWSLFQLLGIVKAVSNNTSSSGTGLASAPSGLLQSTASMIDTAGASVPSKPVILAGEEFSEPSFSSAFGNDLGTDAAANGKHEQASVAAEVKLEL